MNRITFIFAAILAALAILIIVSACSHKRETAAPMMLKALKRIDRASDQEYDVDDGIPNFSEDITLAWQDARAAIAKAGAKETADG